MNAHVIPPPASEETAAPKSAGAIVPRMTIEQIVGHRDRALALYGVAHSAIAAASDALVTAGKEAHQAAPDTMTRYNYDNDRDQKHFFGALKVPDRDGYLAEARKILDRDVWANVIGLTELEGLMDKKAKDQFHQQLLADPPEATVENIVATLEKFVGEAPTMWKRGVAECFSRLDRRFRSHDGWKIGHRIILDRAFSGFGGFSYSSNQRDTMIDVERIFSILAANDPRVRGYGSAVYQVDQDRRHSHEPHQSETHTRFFRVKGYKNGNAHLWFTDDALLARVNQVLGEYYGAPIPEDREPDEDTGLYDAKTLPAKQYGFFPTPNGAADLVAKQVGFPTDWETAAPLSILEPSAGTGQLARRCLTTTVYNNDQGKRDPDSHEMVYPQRAVRHVVDCVEIQPHLSRSLTAEGIFRRVYGCNFLSLRPETTGHYDRVVMNPPFDRERDIDHVLHALEFLKPDGVLVAVMSAGTEFRGTRKSKAFRELMASMNARFGDLPERSFSEVGTNCNTMMVRVAKDGRNIGGRWDYGSDSLYRKFEVDA